MLILENLKKRPKLIDNLKSALTNEKYIFPIANAKLGQNIFLEKRYINDCITTFESGDISLVGSSHGKIMYPLFALDIAGDITIAILKLYLTYPDEKDHLKYDRLKNELTMLTIATSFFYPKIKKIEIRGDVIEFKNNECCLKKTGEVCMLYITPS